ncbi:hypothetical protein MASR1M107_08100 [Ignavibacteriales bacterium]
MKILEIAVNGYKNLGLTRVDLTKNQITALIAPNNYGKSNFLESLDFAYDFIHAGPKLRKAMMEYIPAIPINKHVDQGNFFFEVVFESVVENVVKNIEYSFSFAWKKDRAIEGSLIISEQLRVKDSKSGSKYTKYFTRESKKAAYLTSPSGRCDTKIAITPTNLLINKLSNYDSLFYKEIIETVLNLNFSITSLMDLEMKFGAIKVNDSNKVSFGDLDDGDNISQFLYNLKQTDSNLFKLFENSLKDLVPTIEQINPREINLKESKELKGLKGVPFTLPEKIYDLRVKEKNNNQITGPRFLSRGTRRIILILASAIDAVTKGHSLLAFEELENSIHPLLLQRLLMIITGIAPKLQILVSSHSPYLIQYLPVKSIYFGLPNKEGVARFCTIKNSKQNSIIRMATDADISLGDYLFDLMLDIEPDSSFQEEYFESQV